MTAKRIYGIMPPPIVPFTADGEVDAQKLKAYMNWLVDKGCHCLYVLGTFGSSPLLNVEERKLCAENIVEAVNGRVPVICHIGSQNTNASITLAKHAEQTGVDAIASVPPTYYKHTPDSIKDYFKEILDSVNIPVFVYNFPASVGYGLTPDLVSDLAEMGIAGIKDSSFDLIFFIRLMNAVQKPDFIWVNGVPALMLPAVLLGASAITSGTANAFPEFNLSLWNAIQEKAFDRAADLQKKMVRLAELQGITIPIVGVHEILKLRGLDFGYPRAPLKPFTESQRTRLKDGLTALDLL